jgi:YVTN family beta-propeller protein
MNLQPSLLRLSVLLLALTFQHCRTKPAGQTAFNTDSLKAALTKTRVMLPNGWSLTPIGKSLPLNDLPLNLVVSPTKRYLAVTNNGQSTQSLTLIDAATETVLADVSTPKSWLGLAFSPDERYLFASGGNDNLIRRYRIEAGKLTEDGQIRLGEPWPKGRISPAGLTLDATGQTLFVVTKDDKKLYVCDIAKNTVSRTLDLPAEAYAVLRAPGSGELFVSLWGGGKVLVLDPEAKAITAEVPTGSHPNDLVLSPDGRYLFAACGNENSVSVIDVAARRVVETLTASLYPDAPIGSTPNGLALSDDGRTLYVANADNNCLAVFDVSEPGRSQSRGFIPTGWYPTSVKVVGSKVFVTNGKGFTSKPNPNGPQPLQRRTAETEYIGGLFKGTLSIFEVPDATRLAAYSGVVYENTPYSKQREQQTEGEPGNPIPRKVGDKSPIKYVFYLIKENRTYDQVFGDMPEGNGDPALCLFPERITPNQHALAREYVLLDNFYVDAEVSADGHNWSTAAYANDYVEKNWVTSYGGRGGTYDFEGQRPIAYPKNGFIWDFCQRAGLRYRTYGEFADGGKANLPVLEGHFCKTYRGWDLNYQDILREAAWERDLDSLIALDQVPHFSSLRFGNDHTSGAALGKYTPEASVADNDLAVGRFIEHLSKSKIWAESAVFILEDDAQNGSDHVDAHRSNALVVSPYTKRKFVDHTMYSTAGMLRTMELILGLPPMSQYDAAATPLWRCFTAKADLTPYAYRPAQVSIDARNTAWNRNAKRSAEFNLARMDAAPDLELNQIVWQTVRGLNSVMPAPRRSAFVRIAKNEEEEDEEEGEEDDD